MVYVTKRSVLGALYYSIGDPFAGTVSYCSIWDCACVYNQAINIGPNNMCALQTFLTSFLALLATVRLHMG